MVIFKVSSNIFKVAERITVPTAKGIDEEWLDEDVIPLTSDTMRGTTLVMDFSYSIPSIVQYTLDGGATWVSFNQDIEIMGGQSRYLRVTSGVEVNFRAKQAGTLNRIVVGEI